MRLASVGPPRVVRGGVPCPATTHYLRKTRRRGCSNAYDEMVEPAPPHLTALLKVLEIAATETSQQSASSSRFADQQTREGEFAGRISNESLEVREAGGLRA